MPVALITGGGGGLAQVLSDELGGQGYEVLAPPRSELDVKDTVAVSAYVSGLERLDLLVANAAVLRDQPVLRMEVDDFEEVLNAGLSGAFRVARAALKLMSRQRSGHVVFIGSQAGLQGTAGQANYAAAKAGLLGLAASLAREYGGRNIRVNTVLPGFLDTPMTAGLTEAKRAEFLAAHVLRRLNTPAAAARFIAFLDSALPNTSGQVFNLDSRVLRQM